MDEKTLSLEVAGVLYDHKANDIEVLKVDHLTVLCDYMIIASGRNSNQVRALADDVDEKMAEAGFTLRRSDGRTEGRWIVLDYGHIMVHIFCNEERSYYNLSRLWNDGTNALDLPFSMDEND